MRAHFAGTGTARPGFAAKSAYFSEKAQPQREASVKRVLASAAWLALGTGLMTGSALAQGPGAATPPPTTDVQTGTPTYPPPPGAAPAGYHYEWIFNYDRHGDYLGHWRLVRDR